MDVQQLPFRRIVPAALCLLVIVSLLAAGCVPGQRGPAPARSLARSEREPQSDPPQRRAAERPRLGEFVVPEAPPARETIFTRLASGWGRPHKSLTDPFLNAGFDTDADQGVKTVQFADGFDTQLDRLRAALERDAARTAAAVSEPSTPREEAEALMRQARLEMESDRLAEALQLAQSAEGLAHRARLLFDSEGESPARLVALLRERLTQGTSATPLAAGQGAVAGQPEDVRPTAMMDEPQEDAPGRSGPARERSGLAHREMIVDAGALPPRFASRAMAPAETFPFHRAVHTEKPAERPEAAEDADRRPGRTDAMAAPPEEAGVVRISANQRVFIAGRDSPDEPQLAAWETEAEPLSVPVQPEPTAVRQASAPQEEPQPVIEVELPPAPAEPERFAFVPVPSHPVEREWSPPNIEWQESPQERQPFGSPLLVVLVLAVAVIVVVTVCRKA